MPAGIAAALPRTGPAGAATSQAGGPRCILDSLALAHRRAVRQAPQLSGRRVDVVHIVGGGARNELLCQLTADACGLPVVAGPVEATALGNVLVQARATGEIDGDLAALREVVARLSRSADTPPAADTPGNGRRAVGVLSRRRGCPCLMPSTVSPPRQVLDPPTSGAHMRIALFATCLADTMFPHAAVATVRLLERLGHEVVFPPEQTCCGQMHVNTGYQTEALPLIRNHVRRSSRSTRMGRRRAVGLMRRLGASPAGATAAAQGDRRLARDAAAVGARTFELSELLIDVLGVEDVGA